MLDPFVMFLLRALQHRLNQSKCILTDHLNSVLRFLDKLYISKNYKSPQQFTVEQMIDDKPRSEYWRKKCYDDNIKKTFNDKLSPSKLFVFELLLLNL